MPIRRSKEILRGWKEIASYLRCGVRSAQRYEQSSQLPVRRIPGKEKGSVVAFAKDLDDWLRKIKPAQNAPIKALHLGSRALERHYEIVCDLRKNVEVLQNLISLARTILVTEGTTRRKP